MIRGGARGTGRFGIVPAPATRDRRLKATALNVLTALATYADNEGRSFPSNAKLARHLGISRSAVSAGLKVLTACGYVSSTRRDGSRSGPRTSLRSIRRDVELPVEYDRLPPIRPGGVSIEPDGSVPDNGGSPAGQTGAVPPSRTQEQETQGTRPGETHIHGGRPLIGNSEDLRANVAPSRGCFPPGGRKGGARDVTFPPDFERFWEAYPRKQKKGTALDEWKRINPDAALVEKMVRAVESQRVRREWRTDRGRYIPQPDNWLRDMRWEDQRTRVSE